MVEFSKDLNFKKLPSECVWQIYALLRSVEKFYILLSAIELKIFDHLKIPKRADELAEELGFNTRLIRKLCDTLVVSGFLLKYGDKYQLTEVARMYLTKDSPYYQGDFIMFFKKSRLQRLCKLTEALKCNYQTENIFIPYREYIFAMAEVAIIWDLPRTLEVLRKEQKFMNARKILDLGGGHGLYAVAFAQLNPHSEICVIDLPHVIENITKDIINKYNYKDRIKLISADFMKHDIGSNYDVVFASNILYMPKDKLKFILSKINASLKEGGILISKHWHIDDIKKDGTAVLFDLVLSLDGVDRVFSTNEFCKLLEQCEYSVISVYDIGNYFSPSKIIIAEKN